MGAGGHGSPTLVLKHGAPPGDQFGKYDARPPYDFLGQGGESPNKEVRARGGTSALPAPSLPVALDPWAGVAIPVTPRAPPQVVLDRGHGAPSGLGPGTDRFREGQWFAGVKVEGHQGSNHTQLIHLLVSRYVCPRGCNGHGQCIEVNGTHVCQCETEWCGENI